MIVTSPHFEHRCRLAEGVAVPMLLDVEHGAVFSRESSQPCVVGLDRLLCRRFASRSHAKWRGCGEDRETREEAATRCGSGAVEHGDASGVGASATRQCVVVEETHVSVFDRRSASS